MFNFPVDQDTFRAEIFEREPKLMRGVFEAGAFDWSLLDDALRVADPSSDFVKLLKGSRIDQGVFTEEFTDIGVRRRRIRKEILYKYMRGGATMVLNRIDIFSPVVSDICLEIGQFVGAQASANAYGSFGEEPATNVHWDTHDVFVVQLVGSKHWKLYEPTHPLPISTQISNHRRHEVPESTYLEDYLRAGDVLYVPRGWWHRVTPVGETLHLTVAVHTPLLLDYLIWAAANRLPDHLELRRSLLGRDDDAARVAAANAAIVRALSDPGAIAEFHARARGRERVISPFRMGEVRRGVFGEETPLSGAARLRMNSRYAQASSAPFVNGRALQLSSEQRKVLEALGGRFELTIDELRRVLPDLGEERLRSALVGLVQEDIISFAGSRASSSAAQVESSSN